MGNALPEKVEIAIIGGGIAGCALAYHLAKAGASAVLFERKKLTSGTTWHAAGLVSEAQSVPALSQMAKYGLDLIEKLEEEIGQATGFQRCGSISLALNDARSEELRRKIDFAHSCGIRAKELTLDETLERWPLLSPTDISGSFWFPDDGYTSPIETTMALVKGAKEAGAQFFEDTKVLTINSQSGQVTGIKTDKGEVAANHVVLANGMWANEFGLQNNLCIPLHPTHHYYVVTDPVDGVTSDLPVLRVMDEYTYYKAEAGKLLIGCSEPNAQAWRVEGGIPEQFEFDELPFDQEHLIPILEAATERVPILGSTGIRKFFNGPESFTPDGRPYLGPVGHDRGLWLLAGFNSTGIQIAPGAAKALADLILGGEMTMDLTDIDSRRIHTRLNAHSYTSATAAETLSQAYAMHWPHHRRQAVRGLRRSPYHFQMQMAGADFAPAGGWERALIYGAEVIDSFERQDWFGTWRDEHLTIRNDLGMIDLTFGRFVVQGKSSEATLQYLCGANMAVPIGKLVYTQLFNAAGGIEADVTVARLSADRYMIMASASAEPQVEHWLTRQLEDTDLEFFNMTSGECTLAVMGPRAREYLSELTGADLQNETFAFGTWQNLYVGHAPVRAQRITYVGELGWELHIPVEFGQHVWETIMSSNRPPRLCGSLAVDSCRLEKGFRHWGTDIGPFDGPFESGLMFCCDFSTEFLGKADIQRRASMDCSSRLLQFCLLDPEPLLFANEPVYVDDELVGRITSASYGWSAGAAVGMGYIKNPRNLSATDLTGQNFSISIAGKLMEATASVRAIYDPGNERMRS